MDALEKVAFVIAVWVLLIGIAYAVAFLRGVEGMLP